MSATTLVSLSAWTTALACVSVFLYMLLRIEAHKWISGTLTKYAKVIEVSYITSCIVLYFAAVVVSFAAIYDPQRMATYLTKIFDFVRDNLTKY